MGKAEHETLYHALMRHTADAIIVYDLEGQILDVNEYASTALSYTREELLSMRISDIERDFTPDALQAVWDDLADGIPITIEGKARRKDGTTFPIEARVVLFSTGERPLVIVSARNVTERKRAEEEARAAHEKLRKAHEELRDAHNHLEKRVEERTAELLETNKLLKKNIAERRTGEKVLATRLRYERALADCSKVLQSTDVNINDALTETLQLLLPASQASRVYIFENFDDPVDGLCSRQTFEACAPGVAPQTDNPALQHAPYKNGYGRWQEVLSRGERIMGPVDSFPEAERKVLQNQDILSILVLPIRAGCAWYGFIGFDDTTTRREWGEEDVRLLRTVAEMIGTYIHREQAGEKLLAYQEQLRSFASELALTEERERRRIATALHDTIGQTLALSRIKLAALRESLAGPDHVAEVLKLIEQAIQNTRSLTIQLSPPVLYELGLEAAIEWLLEQAEQEHGLAAEFEDDGLPKPLDHDIQVLLFQAVRELLANIAKYAKADRVKVALARTHSALAITVEDDGVGFDTTGIGPQWGKTGGFGLFNISERLGHLGGSLKVKSEPGRGTRITLSAPLTGRHNGRAPA